MVLTVLVVEDEALIAIAVVEYVAEAGYIPLGPCRSLKQVKEICSMTVPDLALIDVYLGRDESGEDVCAYLHRHFETTCVYMTGHPNRSLVRHGAVGTVSKPYSPSQIPTLLQYMELVRFRKQDVCPQFLSPF